MRETDLSAFSAMLDDVATVLPPTAPLNSTARAMFFRSLANLTLESVRAALDAHVRDPQRGRFFPKPADVLAQVETRDDGRPGADEAWAVAVRSMNEDATIVWTSEIALAWGIARPVMQLGDEVGARIAFRDVYNRLVREARISGTAVDWNASLGHDPEGRAAPIIEAAALRRLPVSSVPLLEGPRDAFAPLLSSSIPADVRARLMAVREKLTGAKEGPYQPSQDAENKVLTGVLKAASAAQVARYEAEHAK